jgi:hypothetical protein
MRGATQDELGVLRQVHIEIRAAGRCAGFARLTRTNPNGHIRRPVGRTASLHRIIRSLCNGCGAGAPGKLVPASSDVCLLYRSCGIVIRRRCRLCFNLVQCRAARYRAGRLRIGQHRPIDHRISRASDGARIGRTNIFYAVAVLTLVWALFFALLARDSPARRPPGDITAMLKVLSTERLAWALSAFYFLTFGGFVAFSIYLPSLLRASSS